MTDPLVPPDLREFLAQYCGCTFPRGPREPCQSRGFDTAPLMVYRQAIHQLGPDALAAYCIVADWNSYPDPITLDRLAERMGDLYRAQDAVEELYSVGMFITSEESEARAQAWTDMVNVADRPPARPARRRLIAPDPWPEYTGENWASQRDDITLGNLPQRGQAVVYFLHSHSRLLYVGSTGDAFSRLLMGHASKPWTRYEARGCPDREAAYWLEAAEIRRHKPPLNRDLQCGGRVALVPRQRRARTVAVR